MAWRLAAAACLALGACAGSGATVAPEDLEWEAIRASYNRAFERSFTEAPFEWGSMAVLAEEGGELRTWNFFPCQAGQAVCSGSPQGPAGRLYRSLDWYVLTGLHGRTFWLSFGGDGYVERGDHYVPLAWNARANGTGEGTLPELETPFPH